MIIKRLLIPSMVLTTSIVPFVVSCDVLSTLDEKLRQFNNENDLKTFIKNYLMENFKNEIEQCWERDCMWTITNDMWNGMEIVGLNKKNFKLLKEKIIEGQEVYKLELRNVDIKFPVKPVNSSGLLPPKDITNFKIPYDYDRDPVKFEYTIKLNQGV